MPDFEQEARIWTRSGPGAVREYALAVTVPSHGRAATDHRDASAFRRRGLGLLNVLALGSVLLPGVKGARGRGALIRRARHAALGALQPWRGRGQRRLGRQQAAGLQVTFGVLQALTP